MITEVKQLKRSIVEVCLTDIANSDQSNLVPNIISNTMRYTELFEDAVDEILPTINVTVEPTVGADLFNVGLLAAYHFQQHRAEVAAAQSAEEQESFESRQVRKELARRYNIVFTPDTSPICSYGDSIPDHHDRGSFYTSDLCMSSVE